MDDMVMLVLHKGSGHESDFDTLLTFACSQHDSRCYRAIKNMLNIEIERSRDALIFRCLFDHREGPT